MNGRNPQVGGTGVKHNSEGLGGCTQANLTIILGLVKEQ